MAEKLEKMQRSGKIEPSETPWANQAVREMDL